MQKAFNQTRVFTATETLISGAPVRIAGIFPEVTTTGTIALRNASAIGGGSVPMHRAAIGLTQAGKQFNAYGVALDAGLTVRLSVGETIATGTFTPAGIAGSVNTLTVNSVNILNAVVPFNTSLTQTAADVAASINTRGLYTASAAAGIVTIVALPGNGAAPNGFVVAGTLTTLTATYANMASGATGDAVTVVWAPLL